MYNAMVLQGSEQKDGTNGQFWARLLLEFNSNISSFICFQDFIQRLLLSSRSMLSFKNTSLYKRNGNTEVRCRSPFHFTLISGGKRQGTHEERDTAVFFLLLPQVQFPQAACTRGSSTDRNRAADPTVAAEHPMSSQDPSTQVHTCWVSAALQTDQQLLEFPS